MLTANPPMSAKARTKAFVALTKPRIIELLLITTVPTMIVAERGLPSVWLMINTVLGGTLAAGGANAFNMYIDRDIDALMHRTEKRPLVTGDVTPKEALIFAFAIEAVAFAWLAILVNLLSAVLALAACAFYVFVYTMWLKRTSSQNIVIGGAAGAVPALIGWSAVTEELSWAAVVLFGIIFFWTPPHFWALAIKYEGDYSAASVPMMPVVEGFRKTTAQMTAYSVVVWALTLLFWQLADMGWLYLVSSTLLGFWFCAGAFRLWQLSGKADVDHATKEKQSIKYFHFSITHLALLFVVMAADQLLGLG